MTIGPEILLENNHWRALNFIIILAYLYTNRTNEPQFIALSTVIISIFLILLMRAVVFRFTTILDQGLGRQVNDVG
jgi:hypothetical protein